MGGGGVNFVAGGLFVNPRIKPAFPAVFFSVWMGLQGTEDVGAAIADSDSDMAALNVRNTQADHILWAVRFILQVVVGPFTMQREVGTCCWNYKSRENPEIR